MVTQNGSEKKKAIVVLIIQSNRQGIVS